MKNKHASLQCPERGLVEFVPNVSEVLLVWRGEKDDLVVEVAGGVEVPMKKPLVEVLVVVIRTSDDVVMAVIRIALVCNHLIEEAENLLGG